MTQITMRNRHGFDKLDVHSDLWGDKLVADQQIFFESVDFCWNMSENRSIVTDCCTLH